MLSIQQISHTSVANVGICRILFIRFKFKTIVVHICSIFKRTNCKSALQIMSYHILCESEDSWERSIVYHTQNENYIVFIQQKKNSEKGCWRSIEHCIIPKMFVNFVATLPDKYVSTEDNGTKTVLTAGGYSVPRKMPLLFPYDIDTLSPDTKRLLYRYDCDCVPILENQLGQFQAIEELAQLWGIQPSPTSPATSPIGSPATNEPSPIVTPETTDTKQKTVIASIMDKMSWNMGSTEQFEPNFDSSLLSETTFVTPTQTAENATVSIETYRTSNNTTPLNSETPKVCNAPQKKRANRTPLIDMFED